MRTLPMVCITWQDSCIESDWLHDADAAMCVAEIRSVGWLLKKTRTTITIAQSIDWEGKTGDRLTVPIRVITKVTHIT